MRKILTLFCVSLLGLCACTSPLEEDGMKEIHLSSTGVVTRGTSLHEQESRINAGQFAGITIKEASSPHQNVAWKADLFGQLVNTSEVIYYKPSGAVQIVAYHPYRSDWNDVETTHYDFSVAADQTGEGYANSDLMWATATSTREDYEVFLGFRHLMAKVCVTVKGASDENLICDEISIDGTQTTADFCNGTVSVKASAQVQTIKAAQHSATAAALIVPQTVSKDTRFILVEHQGSTYHYKLPENMVFEGGKTYEFTLRCE